MTMDEAREQGLEVFFLPTAAEAEEFARYLHLQTGRATGFFTETMMGRFQLHAATVAPRPKPEVKVNL